MNRFETIISYSKLMQFPYDKIRVSELSLGVLQVLLVINKGKRRRSIQKISESFLELVFKKDFGNLEFNGSEKQKYLSQDCEEESSVGICAKDGPVSRFAISWWTDPQKENKYVRIYGDRVDLKNYIIVPKINPIGISAYNLVFPENEINESHCHECKKKWENSFDKNYFENKFFCSSCLYFIESGFSQPTVIKRK